MNTVVRTLGFVTVTEGNNTIRVTTPDKIAMQLDVRIFRLAYVSPEGSRYTAVLTSEFTSREEKKSVSEAGQSADQEVFTKGQDRQRLNLVSKSCANALVVRDTATVLDQMQTIIDKLDIPPKQIHVAVKLISLSDTDSENIGVNWNQGMQFAMTPLSSWARRRSPSMCRTACRNPSWARSPSAAASVRAADPADPRWRTARPTSFPCRTPSKPALRCRA